MGRTARIEAISCGIPVVATAVGGNKEIVDNETGYLLDENPNPEDIAFAISKLMNDPVRLQSLRSGSKKKWVKSYNADKNYDEFVDIVLNSDVE